jgi:sterol desaturase/sphingolipid hydroxylase (fatty acid hydroxylase superfamily)
MYVFVVINSSLLTISYIHSIFFQSHILYLFLFTILRNIAMVKALDRYSRSKQPIVQTYTYPEGEFVHSIVQASMIETITERCIVPLNNQSNIGFACLVFIPMSLCFEILFDFFHYWSHRSLHTMYFPWHKTHHNYIHLKPAITFYQHWMDLLLTNSLPLLLTIRIVQSVYPLSTFEVSALITYKIFTEISGHLGHRSFPTSSFPQCIWLPRLLGIELYCEDHNLHHTNTNYNFSKRFSLWDKVFGTYQTGLSSNS